MLCYLLLWSGLPSADSEVASDAVYLVIQKSVCRCCSSLLGAVTVLPSAGRDGHSAAHWACYDTEIRGSKIGHIIWDAEHFKSMVRSTEIGRYRIIPLQIISGGSKFNSMHYIFNSFIWTTEWLLLTLVTCFPHTNYRIGKILVARTSIGWCPVVCHINIMIKRASRWRKTHFYNTNFAEKRNEARKLNSETYHKFTPQFVKLKSCRGWCLLLLIPGTSTPSSLQLLELMCQLLHLCNRQWQLLLLFIEKCSDWVQIRCCRHTIQRLTEFHLKVRLPLCIMPWSVQEELKVDLNTS